jgi:transposase
VRQVDQLVRVLEGLPDRFEVCFEASTGYGRFFELLSVRACRVVVAHPGLLRLIFRSKHKNDRRDAEKLAKLLYLGEVPAVHVPTADVRAWRELITFRQRLVQKRTRAKNGVRALLRCLGITAPPRPGIWTAKGLAWLKQLEFSQPLQALKRDLLVQEIEAFSQQLARVERGLAAYSRDNLSVWQLRSIPGVGLRTAEAVVAFIDDPHRFAHSKKVGAYFGLVGSIAGSVRRDESARAHHPRGLYRGAAPAGRSGLAGAASLGDRASLLRTHPAKRPGPQENRGGGHRPLPGPRDVGSVEKRHFVEGARSSSGRLTAVRLPWDPAGGRQARLALPAAFPRPNAPLTDLQSGVIGWRVDVEIESGIQVASRRVPWRIATPRA